ncbi:MAG: hypothetical protein ABIJ84_03700 [bacterium]
MAGLILGIILLVIPFVLLDQFSDKKRGFVYILFFSLLFHTVLAFLSQFFGIFYYQLILAAVIIADIATIVAWWKFKKNISFKLSSIEWTLFVVIIVAFLSLYQVHYNYTGKINFATDIEVSYHEVKNMEYVYPYFSDEWYAVLFIENSIGSGNLPLAGFGGEYFMNLEMFFHSLSAEIMLILGLDPLTQYTLFSIFANILIIVLAYIFLRINRVSKLSAGLSSLLILYITSGANLPGIWNFIPLHLGIIFCLIGFCFLALGKFGLATFTSFFVAIFYAPLVIFYGAGLIVFCIFRFKEKIKEHQILIIYSVALSILILPAAYLILMVSPLSSFVSYVFTKILYTSFYGANLNVDFPFYNVIPLSAIFLALWGLRSIYKNLKWFFSVLILGAVFWFFYSFTTTRFLIEYERIVFFVSIIACIISGFGLKRIELYAGKLKNAFKYLEVGFIVLFLLLVPFYTQSESWKKFIVRDIGGSATEFFPKAPANNYLAPDDLRVFEGIKNKRFLSIPWKGTVIGVATKNYPLVTKEGTISMGKESDVFRFLASDCDGKTSMAKEKKIDYVYLYEFNCTGFEKIEKSSEGFSLYNFKK